MRQGSRAKVELAEHITMVNISAKVSFRRFLQVLYTSAISSYGPVPAVVVQYLRTGQRSLRGTLATLRRESTTRRLTTAARAAGEAGHHSASSQKPHNLHQPCPRES